MSFIRPAIAKPVVRAPSRPLSPPRNQQRQPSLQGRGPRPSSPQRQQGHHRQQLPQVRGGGWQRVVLNQPGRPQQTPTSGSGWQSTEGAPINQGAIAKPQQQQYPGIHDNPESGDIDAFNKFMNVKVYNDGNGEGSISAHLNSEGKKLALEGDNRFGLFVGESGKIIDLNLAYRSKNTAWNASDAFEAMILRGREEGLITSPIEVIQMSRISSAQNQNLTRNLESIRTNNDLTTEERQTALERELFTGSHAGRSVLRRLERIGLEPVPGSLKWQNLDITDNPQFGQKDPIKAGDTDLQFHVKKIIG